MSDELDIFNAIRQAPNERVARAIRVAAGLSRHDATPSQMTFGERVELAVFKKQLERQRRQEAERAVTQQWIAKNGGERAIAEKERAQALFSENIHRKGR